MADFRTGFRTVMDSPEKEKERKKAVFTLKII